MKQFPWQHTHPLPPAEPEEVVHSVLIEAGPSSHHGEGHLRHCLHDGHEPRLQVPQLAKLVNDHGGQVEEAGVLVALIDGQGLSIQEGVTDRQTDRQTDRTSYQLQEVRKEVPPRRPDTADDVAQAPGERERSPCVYDLPLAQTHRQALSMTRTLSW